jgi:hypothetical protein
LALSTACCSACSPWPHIKTIPTLRRQSAMKRQHWQLSTGT